MADHHILIVPADLDESMEVEHPASCPQHGHDEPVRHTDGSFVCGVLAEEWESGLETWFKRPGQDSDLFFTGTIEVTPGRHPIEFYMRRINLPPHIGTAEWDAGLALVEGDAQ